MDFVKELSIPIFALGDKLGGFLIPTLVLSSIALLLFATFSFRLLRIALPVAGLGLGYVLGAQFLAPVLANVFKGAGFLTTEMLAGIICAIVVGFICLRSYDFAVIAAGIALGYIFLSELAIWGLRQIKFVQDVLLATDMETAVKVGILLSAVCGFFTLILFKKCFKPTYIFSTTIIAAVIAFTIPAMFIFKSLDADAFRIAVLTASDIGLALGVILGGLQSNIHKYD